MDTPLRSDRLRNLTIGTSASWICDLDSHLTHRTKLCLTDCCADSFQTPAAGTVAKEVVQMTSAVPDVHPTSFSPMTARPPPGASLPREECPGRPGGKSRLSVENAKLRARDNDVHPEKLPKGLVPRLRVGQGDRHLAKTDDLGRRTHAVTKSVASAEAPAPMTPPCTEDAKIRSLSEDAKPWVSDEPVGATGNSCVQDPDNEVRMDVLLQV